MSERDAVHLTGTKHVQCLALAALMEQPSVIKFANRRPGWQPAELDIDELQLHSFADLDLSSPSRQTCPKWCAACCRRCSVAWGTLLVERHIKVTFLQHRQCTVYAFGIVETHHKQPSCVLLSRSQRSRHLYCYDCLVPFTPVPSLQLPFQLSIITHYAEAASKNTGVHAALLCPHQVQLHR